MLLSSALLCLTVALATGATGCTAPDTGVVMACYGVINQRVEVEGISDPEVITNIYFGGCDPRDPGMQIVQRVTSVAAAGDPAPLLAECDKSCNARLDGYKRSHREITLPLSCQTTFVLPCEGLGSNVTNFSNGMVADFQGGGPADTRFGLSGTAKIKVGAASAEVPVTGIADLTISSDTCVNGVCPLIISRFDVVADHSFEIGDIPILQAQVQNQGLIIGQMDSQVFKFAPKSFNLEVTSRDFAGASSFHVFNDDEWIKHNQQGGALSDFFPTFDGFFGDGKVHLKLTSKPIGRRPVAAIAPTASKYECTCEECTPVTLVSKSTDVDQDIQGLTWLLNGKLQPGDGGGAPETLPLQLALNSYTATLVATDSRGAAAAASTTFVVADTIPPAVTPPPSTTMLSCGFPDIGRPSATDACSPNTLVITSDDPGIFRPGEKTVTFLAEDSSLNDGRATAKMTQIKLRDEDRAQCCPPGTNIIWARPNEVLIGTGGPDCLIGTNGDDSIYGLGGDDYIIGGPGNDHLYGGDDNDTIVGNQGDDYIDGGDGKNRIAGGSGNDVIKTGTGDDTIFGGEGDDTVEGGDGDNYIMGGPGRDKLTAGKNNDWIDGGDGSDEIFGGEGNDTLIGGVGDDRDHIVGGPGKDFLAGLDGDDLIDGGSDDDVILGGRGRDTCVVSNGTDKAKSCEEQR